MQLPPFKCRASATGAMMTNPRSGDGLSKSCIGVIEDWVKFQIYNRRKDFSSKQIVKGVTNEDDAIEFMSQFYDLGMAFKNEQHFEDDYFTGTPDIITDDTVIDIKCSWDCYTFPMFSEEIPTKGYELQLMTYMWLTGRRKAKLTYCLMDAPENLIDKAAYFQAKDLGLDDTPVELYDKVKAHMTYEDLPANIRIKSYDFDFDHLALARIQTRVSECRDYIKKYIQPKLDKIKL